MVNIGSVHHQKILNALVDLLSKDPNVHAFGVFGSLSRGDWDIYSDLDLDAVVADDASTTGKDAAASIEMALSAAGFQTLLLFEEGRNEWVFILHSLDRISIRFHVLAETSPNIIDSLLVLSGKLSKETIAAAAEALPKKPVNLEQLQNKFIEQAVYLPIYVHRNELINAYNTLNTLRNSLVTMYVKSHGLSKIEKFEKHASPQLLEELHSTVSRLDQEDIKASFTKLLRLYIRSIDTVSGGAVSLSANQINILERALSY